MIPSEEGIRLAKRVAAEQNCSRREAEALIVAGGVQVAGKVVTDPARRVREEQIVQVNRLVSMAALAPLTLVLFKPAHRVANLAWLQDTVGLKAPQPGLWGPERLAKMQMPLPLAKPASGLCIFRTIWACCATWKTAAARWSRNGWPPLAAKCQTA